jgi:hypothetical protein
MQYQQAVAEARSLVKRSEEDQWRLAELTWEQVQAGRSRSKWAEDIDISPDMTSRWYRLWEEWRGVAAAARPPFAEALSPFNRHSEEIRTKRGIRNLSPERRAEVVRELLTDPEVAHETFNTPQPDDEIAAKARMYAGNAISHHDQRIQEHVQEKRHQEAVTKGRTDQEALYELSAMMQVLADVVVTGGKLARKLSEGATLSKRARQSLADYAAKAKATIEWLEGVRDEQHAEDIDEVLRVWVAES